MYPFITSNLAVFSWRAVASHIYMCPTKPDINIECWLAIVCQEKIATFLDVHQNTVANFDTLGLGLTWLAIVQGQVTVFMDYRYA